MHKTETIVLEPGQIFPLSVKTGISQAELELRYMGADENGEEVVFVIETRIVSIRRKKN